MNGANTTMIPDGQSSETRPRILVFGAHPFPRRQFRVEKHFDARLLFRWAGGNLGNCIIGEYALSGIRGDFTNVTHFPGHFPYSPEEANERFNHILVVAANWFTNNWVSDFSREVVWFSKLRIPVTVIGLGQQLPSTAVSKTDRQLFARSVPDSFIRLIRVWLDHGPSIAVRGSITKDLLSYVGICDVVPTGCPTWFVNGSNQPTIGLNEKLSYSSRIAIHGSLRSSGRLFSFVSNYSNAVYVIQSEVPLMAFSGKNPPPLSCLPVLLRHATGLSPTVVRSHNPAFLHFSNLKDWERFLRTCSFSFGERIHGTICAIKNGIPAVIIRHDQRIAEFVDLFGIPSVGLPDLEKPNFSITSVFERADFTTMNRRYPILLSEYRAFLQSHGLEPDQREITTETPPFSESVCPFDWKRAIGFEWKCCFSMWFKKARIKTRLQKR